MILNDIYYLYYINFKFLILFFNHINRGELDKLILPYLYFLYLYSCCFSLSLRDTQRDIQNTNILLTIYSRQGKIPLRMVKPLKRRGEL